MRVRTVRGSEAHPAGKKSERGGETVRTFRAAFRFQRVRVPAARHTAVSHGPVAHRGERYRDGSETNVWHMQMQALR